MVRKKRITQSSTILSESNLTLLWIDPINENEAVAHHFLLSCDFWLPLHQGHGQHTSQTTHTYTHTHTCTHTYTDTDNQHEKQYTSHNYIGRHTASGWKWLDHRIRDITHHWGTLSEPTHGWDHTDGPIWQETIHTDEKMTEFNITSHYRRGGGGDSSSKQPTE